MEVGPALLSGAPKRLPQALHERGRWRRLLVAAYVAPVRLANGPSSLTAAPLP
jgi:hypothetical protein